MTSGSSGSKTTAAITLEVVRETFQVTTDDGVRIFGSEKHVTGVEIKGTVLLLHPMNGLGHRYWDLPLSDYSFMDYLARHGFRVFALDFRGFGDSDHPNKVTWEGCSKDVEAVVEHIKKRYAISKVHLIATSFGATVAAYFAGKNQDSIERLVLFGLAGYKEQPTPEREKVQKAMLDLVNKGVYYVHEKPSLEPGPEIYDSPPEMMRLYHDLIKEKNPTRPTTQAADIAGRSIAIANISQIKVPTLIACGEHDLSSRDSFLRCFNDLPAREKAYVEVGNAGHSQVRERVHMVLFRLLLGWISH